MDAVLRKLSLVRRRLRTQRALEAATLAAVAAAALACALLFAVRAGWVEPRGAWLGAWALATLPVAAALGGLLRRIGRFDAARALDAANALGDRIASALALGGDAAGSPAFKAALERDAARAAAGADARRAAPLRLPRDLRALALAAAALAATWAVALPAPPAVPHAAAAPPMVLAITPGELALAAAATERAAAAADRVDDEELRRLAADLRSLWADVRDEKIGRDEAFARLAAVEERADRATPGEFPLVRGKLKLAAKAFAKDRALGDLGRALDVEDFAKARAELDRLAAALAAGTVPDAEMRRLARTVAAAAAALATPTAPTAEEKRADALRKDIAALEAKKDRTPDEERTLDRKKKDLAALESEMEKAATERKIVERLERDLEDLAAALGAADRAGAAGEAQETADDLDGLESKLGRSGAIDALKKALAEGKLAVSSGKMHQRGDGSEDGEGGEGAPGGDGESGAGLSLKMRRFMIKAGHAPGAAPGGSDPGGPGTLPPPGGAGDEKPGSGGGKGDAGDGSASRDAGDGKGPGGAGDAHAPGTSAAPTALSGARYKDLDVPGKHGAGPVRSTVMMGAATRGFAVRGYRPMYDAAAASLEDALDEDRVPLGYKLYVRRYMELIRPE